ncbi:hypothetical protein H6A07_03310 [Olsenella uli]|uniref:hypothetical protein n=1 Tax=Olsenella uli TaxID=133926 RepID=UPI00195BF4B6|nr:hypothetical protein [Olsenella uli]MBM6675771.1 hypothetical protein [Olsenella uli]
MDIPHWPYWKKNSLGGTQIWYTDLPDCPFDVPSMGEKDERAVDELKQLAEKYGANAKTGRSGKRDGGARRPRY